MMSEKRIKCPVCKGMGCLDLVLRSGVDEDGNPWKEYPVCGYCKGERYVTDHHEERTDR